MECILCSCLSCLSKCTHLNHTQETLNVFDGILPIDTISKEVEEAIMADRTLGGLAKDTYVESTEIEYTGEGEQPVGYVTLTFLTNYYVQETNPDVAV